MFYSSHKGVGHLRRSWAHPEPAILQITQSILLLQEYTIELLRLKIRSISKSFVKINANIRCRGRSNSS